MPKKIELKTKVNIKKVSEFLNEIEDKDLKRDCKILHKIFRSITKKKAKMWGDSIIGYGSYTYYRSNGDEGVFMATGFSPRKSGPTIYIMPGYSDLSKLLKDLGPHKLGKSCLYLKSLDNIDLDVLEKIILKGLKELKKSHVTDFKK